MKDFIKIDHKAVEALKKKIHQGEVIPAKVVSRIAKDNYIIEIKKIRVIARSIVNLIESVVYVIAENLEPKIHLKLLTCKKGSQLNKIFEISDKLNLPLTRTNFSILHSISNLTDLSDDEVTDIVDTYSQLFSSSQLIPVYILSKLLSSEYNVQAGRQIKKLFGCELLLECVSSVQQDNKNYQENYLDTLEKAFILNMEAVPQGLTEKSIKLIHQLNHMITFLNNSTEDKSYVYIIIVFPSNKGYIPILMKKSAINDRAKFIETQLDTHFTGKLFIDCYLEENQFKIQIYIENTVSARTINDDINHYDAEKLFFLGFPIVKVNFQPLICKPNLFKGVDTTV